MNFAAEIALAIEVLAAEVKSGCTYQKIQLNALDWESINAIKDKTGFDLGEFSVVVDTHAMQHTLKKHGTKAESLRGQKEIVRSDFQKIPLLLATTDDVLSLGLNRMGRECVGFEKNLDGYQFRAVMEIRTGRREFALVSLYTVGRTSKEFNDSKR